MHCFVRFHAFVYPIYSRHIEKNVFVVVIYIYKKLFLLGEVSRLIITFQLSDHLLMYLYVLPLKKEENKCMTEQKRSPLIAAC